jgi:hypothetical protein
MPKAKLSVSVDRDILERAVRLGGDRSRSQIVEGALAEWAQSRHRADVDAAIARYYAARTPEERADDEEWAQGADDVFTPRRGGR